MQDKIEILRSIGLQIASFNQSTGEVRARCPMPDHEDRVPSFYFNVNTELFICFGCGYRGRGLAKLIHDVTGLSYDDIKQKWGVLPPKFGRPNNAHKQWLNLTLQNVDKAASYLDSRGISLEVARAVKLGWAEAMPPGARRWRGLPAIVLVSREPTGRIVAVQMRTSQDGIEPRYYNAGKVKNGLFFYYGEVPVRDLAIFESPMDAMAWLTAWGLDWAVIATWGTQISQRQSEMLAKVFAARPPVVVLDRDYPSFQWLSKLIKIMSHVLRPNLRVWLPPAGFKDFNEWWLDKRFAYPELKTVNLIDALKVAESIGILEPKQWLKSTLAGLNSAALAIWSDVSVYFGVKISELRVPYAREVIAKSRGYARLVAEIVNWLGEEALEYVKNVSNLPEVARQVLQLRSFTYEAVPGLSREKAVKILESVSRLGFPQGVLAVVSASRDQEEVQEDEWDF